MLRCNQRGVRASIAVCQTCSMRALLRHASTSTPARKRVSKSKGSASKLVSELPSRKASSDGLFVKPLIPLHGFGPSDGSGAVERVFKAETVSKSHPSNTIALPMGTKEAVTDVTPSIGIESLEKASYRAAVAAGVVPDSALAEQVFHNWRRFPDCVVLTRVGKFYESYFAPAAQLASMLSLKLAYKRYSSGLYPFAGFPVSHLDKYLKMLVHDLRHSVVLVEEFPDSHDVQFQSGENITRRVGRIVTPGTLLDDSWISRDESRYLLAIVSADAAPAKSSSEGNGQEQPVPISLAYADVSTGEFYTKNCVASELEDELARIAPKEILLEQKFKHLWSTLPDSGLSSASNHFRLLLESCGAHITFNNDRTAEVGDEGGSTTPPADIEAHAIWLLRRHLQYTLRDNTPDLTTPERQDTSAHMLIDAATLHALEIRHAWRADGADSYTTLSAHSEILGDGLHASPLSSRGTLLSVLRRTVTAAGTRLLTRTLTSPLTNLALITRRLDLVEAFVAAAELRRELRLAAKEQIDVMRLMQRFKARRGDGRDLADLGRWLHGTDAIVRRLQDVGHDVLSEGAREVLQQFAHEMQPDMQLAEIIGSAVDEDVLLLGTQTLDDLSAGDELDLAEMEAETAPEPLRPKSVSVESRMEIREREREEKELTWWIKASYSPQLTACHVTLDALRKEKELLQSKLRRRYNAPSLLLTRGQRYGYFVSVSKKVEAETLAKASRFSPAGVKAYVHGPWLALGIKIDEAADQIHALQRQAFESLRGDVVARAKAVKATSDALSELDLVLGFAQAAKELNLVRPELADSTDLEIRNGRHPTVEAGLLASARVFTPNSICMKPPTSQLHVITGPNQGGKSTILRQTALIAILAQAGSFVPADSARIGIVDRVFSRIGARDDLFRDQSTFMLEMVETAAILRQATSRSLVIMDEIGRGTTLQAGISIAYATLDHLLKNNGCRTLFATHYHELGSMLGYSGVGAESEREGVEFWCTDVEEEADTFSYSYKLQPGLNHQSHAIKAAKLAGMPVGFLSVAEATLAELQAVGHRNSSTDT